MTIESFAVECFLGDRRVYEMNTVCGIFPPEAFASQVGLAASADERVRLAAPSDFLVDLSSSPPRYCAGELRLAGPMLLMLDQVTDPQNVGAMLLAKFAKDRIRDACHRSEIKGESAFREPGKHGL
jgi:hypothetical protein